MISLAIRYTKSVSDASYVKIRWDESLIEFLSLELKDIG